MQRAQLRSMFGPALGHGDGTRPPAVAQRKPDDAQRVLPRGKDLLEVLNDGDINPHYRYSLVLLNNHELKNTDSEFIDPSSLPGVTSEVIGSRRGEKITDSHYFRNLARPEFAPWEERIGSEAPRDTILRTLYEHNGLVPLQDGYGDDDTLEAFGLSKDVFDAAFMSLWKVEKKVNPTRQDNPKKGLELSRGGGAKLDSSLGEATDVARNNAKKTRMFGLFLEMMQGLGIPVFLTGGAVASIAQTSPRGINDLDYRTTAVKQPFSESKGIVDKINARLKETFPESKIDMFTVNKENTHAIDANVDNVHITVARIMNLEDLEVYDERDRGMISARDLILDKAATFIFRKSDSKKVTDLFDLLWTMKQQRVTPGVMLAMLKQRRSQNYARKAEANQDLAADITDEFASALAAFVAYGSEAIHKLFLSQVSDKGAIKSVEEDLGKLKRHLGIASDDKGKSSLLIQAGNMTGDMFGVHAALLNNPYAHVLVIPEGSERDKTPTLVNFYSSGVERSRIHVLINTTDDMSDLYTKYSGRNREPLPYDLVKPELPATLRSPSKQHAVSDATSQTAANWNEDSRGRIRKSWGVNDESAENAAGFLKAKGIPEERKYAVMWSRFSGKKGGPHAQHDTSFEGMRQMINLARREGYIVLIAGDKPADEEKNFKFEKMTVPGAVFDLTEFWNDSAFVKAFPEGGRQAQFNFFEYLMQHGGVKHLGFRSGNLEAYALIGHDVRYMEEEGNLQAGRMEAWHGGRIGYDRITIGGRMPSRTGRYVVNNARREGRESKPPWIEHRDHSLKYQEAIDQAPRGFEAPDLHKIHQYFNDDATLEETLDLEIRRRLAVAESKFITTYNGLDAETKALLAKLGLIKLRKGEDLTDKEREAIRPVEWRTLRMLVSQAFAWGWGQEDLNEAQLDWVRYATD
jgi:hypothetical protein